MTKNELLRRFPNASTSTIRANCEAGPQRLQDTKPQPNPQQPLVSTLQGSQASKGRIGICFTSHRVRLLDRDNLYGGGKCLLDRCVEAGLLPGDTEAQAEVEWRQVKVRTKKDEMTVIEITYP